MEPWQETHLFESSAATSQGRSSATAPLPDPPVPDPPAPDPDPDSPVPEPPVPNPVVPVPPVPAPEAETIEPTQPVSATSKGIDRVRRDDSANFTLLMLGSTQE